MKLRSLVLTLSALAAGACATSARAADASAPRGTTLNVYDSGFGLISELRSVVFTGGDDTVQVRQLPARLDPATISLTPVAGGKGVSVLEQRFEHDLASPERLLRRYVNRSVKVDGREGKLLGAPAEADGPALLLGLADGSVVSFASPEQAGDVTFPDAGRAAFLEPTLIWRARSPQEGPQNLRLSYLAEGLSWDAAYDVVVGEGGAAASLAARVAVRNASGGRFQDARVKLVLTEKGRVAPLQRGDGSRPADTDGPALRYAYRAAEPQMERTVASLAPVDSYELPEPMTLEPGQESYVQLAWTDTLPVSRFYVYDGVRFDRFQRNRRNDWNYGTEFHTTVDTHLEFQNVTSGGLGFNLPPGRVNLYQRRGEGALDLLGSDLMAAVPAGQSGYARLGPARGLLGERERTGYTEVKPLHEYEESFEVRLANDSDQEVQVRVVEHLYRWHDYEIVKSDAEYTTISPQTIEFRPDLKPGGKRSIHYTVRYRW
jgi:hypothetical protein